MLKIRLRRVGKKNQPSYRVVVTEHTAPVQGSYLELLGSYNPRASTFLVKQDRVLHWLDHGAQPSERMAKLLKSAGVEHKLIVLPDYNRKPKRASKKAAPEATAPVAAAPVVKKTAPVEETNPEPVSPESETLEAEQTTPEPTAIETPIETPPAEGGSNLQAAEDVKSEE